MRILKQTLIGGSCNLKTPEQEQPKQAVALKYNQEQDRAPKVVAKGKGFVAEQLLAVARQNAIPVYQNKTLSNMLMTVELDKEIPPELYRAVAEVLAFIYHLDQNARKK